MSQSQNMGLFLRVRASNAFSWLKVKYWRVVSRLFSKYMSATDVRPEKESFPVDPEGCFADARPVVSGDAGSCRQIWKLDNCS